jgi:Uma2 family endonuclease
VATAINDELGPPFKRGRGGPGGWIILFEPELHFGDQVLVPDLAGWRRDRLPFVPEAPYLELAPDWICEVVSKSNERWDRIDKMPIYASVGVRHAWLVSARRRTVEAFRLHDGNWLAIAVHKDDDRARIEPFDAIELDLALLWADLPLPTHATEEPGYYDYAG